MTRMTIKVKKSPKAALRALERINKKMKGPNIVKVGLPRGSMNYPDGTSVIRVGTVHEFGSGNVPERSYLRSTMEENRREYRRIQKNMYKKVIKGKVSMKKALSMIGEKVKGDVQQKITDISEPPLKVRVGGNPLVDTGHLRSVINYQIGDGDAS